MLTVPMVLRAEELAIRADLSYASVARVLALDYGREVTRNEVKSALHSRGVRREARSGRPFTASRQ